MAGGKPLVAIGWKMLLAERAVTAPVKSGLMLASVEVCSRDREPVEFGSEVGKGKVEECPDVSRDVSAVPLVDADIICVIVCTADVESAESDASGTLTEMTVMKLEEYALVLRCCQPPDS